MKTFKLILLGIFVLYFQIIFSGSFSFLKVIPNFLIAYIIYLGIKSGMRTALTISFLCGLAADLLQPQYLGMNALIFILLIMIINNFHESINKRRFIVVFFSIFLINLGYYLIFMFYNIISMQNLTGFFSFFWIAVFYNTLITILAVYFFELFSKLKIVLDV
jgi:rod shape-determining protein MreD